MKLWLVASLAYLLAATTPQAREVTTERFSARTSDGRALGQVLVTTMVRPGPSRPILFAFNGGPGAASAWLSLGVLGPLRAVVPDDPAAPIPAAPVLVPNAESPVDIADLVFIDPLATGFSRAAPGIADAAIFDWRADGAYIADIIRQWLDKHRRRDAPVYLIGESYGTERAVAVADSLTTGRRVNLRGVVLVSQSITVENTLQRPGNALGQAVGLPTIAAIGCYFRLSTPVAAPSDCARDATGFALDAYLPALARGASLDEPTRQSVRARLVAMTGLPAAYFDRNGLALTKDAYRAAALAGRGLLLGMYDARYTMRTTAGRVHGDPFDALVPAMTDAARRFHRQETGLSASPFDGRPYVLLASYPEKVWRYGSVADPYRKLDMSGMLSRALDRAGGRVMIAGGLFDTAGSYGADIYLAGQLDLPRDRIVLRSYDGGHMFYFNTASRVAFADDLRTFLRAHREGAAR